MLAPMLELPSLLSLSFFVLLYGLTGLGIQRLNAVRLGTFFFLFLLLDVFVLLSFFWKQGGGGGGWEGGVRAY